MSILAIVLVTAVLFVAVGHSTFSSIQSEITQHSPKERVDEPEPAQ